MMLGLGAAQLLLVGILAASLMLMLLRPRGIAEVWWVGGGAVLLVALRLVPLQLAGRTVAQGADVYLFLFGMMLLAELARSQGVFDWIAGHSVHQARGSSARLFTLVYAVGVVVTVLMSNDATAVVLTPAILAAVRKAKLADPLPALFACALVANAASFVLPISNPANLVVFRQGMPSLGGWLAAFALPSVLSIAATYGVLRWLFRCQLRARIDSHVQPEPLRREGRLVVFGLAGIVALLLTASALGWKLGLPTALAAAALAGAVCWQTRQSPHPLLGGISWSTLLLVAGLFVLVNAAEQMGALQWAQAGLAAAGRLGQPIGAGVVAAVVGVADNLANNLPIGLLAGATLHSAHSSAQQLLAQVTLMAVDLGPNLSVTGSLATILWLLALRAEKIKVSGWQFLKVGAVAMPLALAAAVGGALLLQAMR